MNISGHPTMGLPAPASVGVRKPLTEKGENKGSQSGEGKQVSTGVTTQQMINMITMVSFIGLAACEARPARTMPVSSNGLNLTGYFTQSPDPEFFFDSNRCTNFQNSVKYSNEGLSLQLSPYFSDCRAAEVRSTDWYNPRGTWCAKLLLAGDSLAGSVAGFFAITEWTSQWQHREMDVEIYGAVNQTVSNIYTNFIHENPGGVYFDTPQRMREYSVNSAIDTCFSIYENAGSPSNLSAQFTTGGVVRTYDFPAGRVPDDLFQIRFNHYSPKLFGDDRLPVSLILLWIKEFCYNPNPNIRNCLTSNGTIGLSNSTASSDGEVADSPGWKLPLIIGLSVGIPVCCLMAVVGRWVWVYRCSAKQAASGGNSRTGARRGDPACV